MKDSRFTLAQVLTVALEHPFYSPFVQYPPDAVKVATLLKYIDENETSHVTISLPSWPLTHKKTL